MNKNDKINHRKLDKIKKKVEERRNEMCNTLFRSMFEN